MAKNSRIRSFSVFNRQPSQEEISSHFNSNRHKHTSIIFWWSSPISDYYQWFIINNKNNTNSTILPLTANKWSHMSITEIHPHAINIIIIVYSEHSMRNCNSHDNANRHSELFFIFRIDLYFACASFAERLSLARPQTTYIYLFIILSICFIAIYVYYISIWSLHTLYYVYVSAYRTIWSM